MTVTTDETGNEGTVEVTEQPPEEKESDAKGNEGSGLEKDTEEEEKEEEEGHVRIDCVEQCLKK